MALSLSELQQLLEAHRQAETAINAVKLLNNLSHHMLETSAELQTLKDSGRFDLWPADFKLALLRYWNIYKAATSAIEEDSDIQTILNWSSY